jgi:isochorismate pyruvate lyase
MTEPELQARSPAECADMDCLRAQIDRIDRILVKILAERQRYIERAAELKAKREAVRDEARIQDVIAKVLRSAQGNGLDPGLAEAVYRVLVECSIALELKAFIAKNRPGTPG